MLIRAYVYIVLGLARVFENPDDRHLFFWNMSPPGHDFRNPTKYARVRLYTTRKNPEPEKHNPGQP